MDIINFSGLRTKNMSEFSTQHEDDHVQHERKINSIIAPEDVDKILCKNVSDLSIIEDSCIITPRSYQYEMLEESLIKNIILAMDTGSGKTQV